MWVEGRCILARVELSALSPPELYSLCYVMWMDWVSTDSDVRNAQNNFTRSMMDTVHDPDADIEDPGDAANPFPGVMRTGPSGPAVKARG